MALSVKQTLFINEYLRTFNATQAALAAGYSEKTARSIGAENLTKPDIAQAIKERLQESAMSADEVLMRLAEQARASYADCIETGGKVNIEKLITSGKAHLIKSIKETEYGRNVEFYDAQAALIQLGKHHKLFTDVSETKHSGKLEIEYVNDWRDA